MKQKIFGILFFLSYSFGFLFGDGIQAAELLTNAAHFSNAPPWLTSTRVNRVVDQIQQYMEWSTRRIEVVWYSDQKAFESAHSLGPYAAAVSFRNQNRVLLGPQVNEKSFDALFGHEIVHVISYQKYQDAIPKWLEEGLANHLSHLGQVDYGWLAKQKLPEDVRGIVHPMAGTADEVRVNYLSSQALAEMLSAKCDFRNLLRLSVQRGMEGYLDTFCRIPDLNAAFRQWMISKTKSIANSTSTSTSTSNSNSIPTSISAVKSTVAPSSKPPSEATSKPPSKAPQSPNPESL